MSSPTTDGTYRPEASERFTVPLDSADSAEVQPPEPKASPLARGWTVVTGLVLVALAGITVRDILIVNDTVSGQQLLPPVFDWFATVHEEAWMLWAGIGFALVALFFLAVTVRPRRRTHMAFHRGSALYARPVDIARLSTAAALRTPGVLSGRTVATPKKISVTVVTAVTADSTETIRDRVSRQVSELATLLDPSPEIRISVTTGDDPR